MNIKPIEKNRIKTYKIKSKLKVLTKAKLACHYEKIKEKTKRTPLTTLKGLQNR